MYGFEQSKTALGLNNILSIIGNKCISELGRQNILNLAPLTEKNKLVDKLKNVEETGRIIEKEGRLPLGSFFDIRILLNKIEPQNSYLETKECLEIQNILEICQEINTFFKIQSLAESPLKRLTKDLSNQKTLLSQLQFTIDPAGNIFDNASKELKTIRKKIYQLRDDVNRKLENISSKNSEHLQEEYVTLRDGRLVLPVREFSVSKISGIVHGQSSSGATKFVEPMAVVQTNNEIQELLISEKREVIKILTRLSVMIREAGEELRNDLSVLVELDSLQARARYGLQVEAVFPEIVDDHYWLINNGRHPVLLDLIKKETVPLTLEIGDPFNTLVISGPNAGGKTVAMKTVGLLQLMLQCSIPIPVSEGSKFPICDRMFVLIGDKQSIENDLSTFSSHITGLNEIVENVKEKSLVLIDEIGIGTEPSGGAALAIAVLEQLNRPDVVSLVSTHQNQLKLYASETTGVENAAMQFDIEHLKPLFILETGIPGSSFTFDICKRFGMSQEIIDRSRQLEGNSNQDMANLLNDISEKSNFYQNEVRELSLKQSKLDALIKLYESNSTDLKKNKRKLEKEAKQQAKDIIEHANKKIEATIRSIKESSADKNTVKNARRELNNFKTSLEEPSVDNIKSDLTIDQVKIGQKVRSLVYNVVGNISKIFKNKNAIELEREGLKLTVNISEVELLNNDGQVVETKPAKSASTAHIPSTVAHEVDVRGCETHEALERVDAYLDSAVHSEWNEVTIIHGKGTGALRTAVQQFLAKNKSIKEYRTGRYGEGETGVTIVSLK
ncbi:MAG: endonuclease MutS2 [Calditrichaeota bacterium]|nr:MAG: endonuclease MutS2 [Calditrichota bacterium]MBL1204424.1 endonuclease MutS2 [Calditrichota bacterium]NOG44253.1 endonuclease MutS2 [Calditrichota bacterium]